MKNFKKLFIILVSSFLLSSCSVTDKLWEPRAGYDKIESFFVDKEKKRVVLIGEAGYATKIGTYHYSISDPENKILKVFELGEKSSQKVDIYMHGVKTTGAKITSGLMWVGYEFKSGNLSQEDINYLRDQKLVSRGRSGIKEYVHLDIPYLNGFMIRYPSTQEPMQNYQSQIIKLDRPWSDVIWNNYTSSEASLRLVATPFTIIADIILSPVYIYAYIKEAVYKKHDSKAVIYQENKTN